MLRTKRSNSTFIFFCLFVFFLLNWISAQRNVQSVNAGLQILCTGQTNPARYAYYGCWCGPLNTGGRTVDDLDKCCMEHDFCFREARKNHGRSTAEALKTVYTFRCEDNTPSCSGGGLGRDLCECDRALAVCTYEHRRSYNRNRIFFPLFRNRRCRE